MNSEVEKKKRDIVDLSERIRIIEVDLKERREAAQKIIK
jgi:hypothetical protein